MTLEEAVNSLGNIIYTIDEKEDRTIVKSFTANCIELISDDDINFIIDGHSIKSDDIYLTADDVLAEINP